MDEAPDTPRQTKEPGTLFLFVVLCLCVGIFVALAIPRPLGPRTTPKNACINNLRMLDGAKQTWALEHQRTNGDVPAWADIQVYLDPSTNNRIVLKCPVGGIYTLGAMSNKPVCSIPDHILP